MDFTIINIIFCILKYFFFLSSVCVLPNVQTISAVFCLILAFLSAAFMFILGGAVSVGFILIVVYVGAVLISFLFVTMMLDIRVEVKFNSLLFGYIVCAIGISLLTDLIILCMVESIEDFEFLTVMTSQTNIVTLGYILYTWYAIPFILCSFILLVAMIGAIVLLASTNTTVSKNSDNLFIHSQDIGVQISVQDFSALELSHTVIYYP